MDYPLVWIVIVVAGLAGTAGLVLLTRGMKAGLLRSMLRWLPPIVLMVPSPVPGYSGSYAPAFVVAIFESLFQADGSALTAALILLLAFLAGVVLCVAANRISKPDSSTQNSAN